jgi:tetratricopeptide (TPR) repeat protein
MSNSINKLKLLFLLTSFAIAGIIFALMPNKPLTELEYRQDAEKIAQRQEWQVLETLAKEWQQQHPASEMSYTALGDSFRMRGNFSAAAEAYSKAVKIAPGNPQIWAYHGIMMLEMSNFAQAAASCQSSIVIKPDHAEAWYCLALAKAELSQSEATLEALSRLLALNSKLHETAQNVLRSHTCKKTDRNLSASLCGSA